MRIVLLGAPGAGKGTIAKLLSDYDGSVQISTGDILRNAVKAKTKLGMEAQGYMERGELVPDKLIMDIMEARLQEPDCAKGYLLDGFPRTIPQAEELKKLLTKLRKNRINKMEFLFAEVSDDDLNIFLEVMEQVSKSIKQKEMNGTN